jgi:regulator of RNase E activity RraB
MNPELEPTAPNAGSFILEQLKESGSELDQKHEVTFWLYFPDKESADQAARRADAAGLHPEISPPAKDGTNSNWLCLLTCAHIPDESILDGIGEFCAELADDFEGKFDGWEARLELDEGQLPPQFHAGALKLSAGKL